MLINEVTMFLQRNTKRVGSKTYTSVLMVERFRKNKKVHSRTIANISKFPPQVIAAIDAALKNGIALSSPKTVPNDDFSFTAGKNFGGLWAVKKVAEHLFIPETLGASKNAMLVMIMICGRILTQGSRRHLKFWKDGQAVEEIFGVKSFDEDDLYAALDWLATNQEDVENKLFRKRHQGKASNLFLYDITSSYLEGQYNELAEYGYNRDGKKGKKQIVIGLLTDKEGYPLAIEVFRGNTSDSTTVDGQIEKLAKRFNVKEVVLVGDRGMIRKTGIESLAAKHWFYVTAITKPQIEKLLSNGVIQMDLFDDELVEVEAEDVRYILRCNPMRAVEIKANRNDKIRRVKKLCATLNTKLSDHPRAGEKTALKDLSKKIDQLKLTGILRANLDGRKLILTDDESAMAEVSRLDGCYVIKTNVKKENLSTEEAHAVYKDLKFVEWAFRSMKTGFLEIRPLFHRKANRTRACALIAMFAYMILHHIHRKTAHLETPLEPLVEKLDQIQIQKIKIGRTEIKTLPTILRDDQKVIMDALAISLPKTLPQNKAA